MPAGTGKLDATRAIARLALTVLCVLVLAACVVLPVVPETESLARLEAARSAIRPGVSTRTDVLLLIAEPQVRGEHDSYFLYLAHRYGGGMALIGRGSFERVVVTDYRCYILAVQFDSRGTVNGSRMFEGRTFEQMTPWAGGHLTSAACEFDGELRQTVQTWLDEP
jgi:hypothetical protein